jgi:hypothetical protein
MGIKKQPGPYRMNQEHLLPRFAPVTKTAVGSAPQPDKALIDRDSAGGKARTGWRRADSPRAVSREKPARGSLFARWARQLSGRGHVEMLPEAPPAVAPRVQTELSLDAVKVVRNDLTDCDFEVIATGGKSSNPFRDPKSASSQPRAFGMVWRRLNAGLLRQAAIDFTIVQKQRGKLLSQAGHGDGSAGGS